MDRVIYATFTLMSTLIIYNDWQQLRVLAVIAVIVGPLAVGYAAASAEAIAQQHPQYSSQIAPAANVLRTAIRARWFWWWSYYLVPMDGITDAWAVRSDLCQRTGSPCFKESVKFTRRERMRSPSRDNDVAQAR